MISGGPPLNHGAQLPTNLSHTLDPACGSMHFGLYAFDLFEVIYDEFWELVTNSASGVRHPASSLTPVNEIYPDKQSFLCDVPRLIIEHNLHGIDIDPRCAQIAAMSLWLRAQRTWQQQDLRPSQRPQIRRSNIACAEPMPGEEAMLREFTAQLQPRLLGQLVEAVFEKMKLAGEAGSLLKIEKELRGAIAAAKKQWLGLSKAEQLALFPDQRRRKAEQMSLFDLSGISDAEFWEDVEERVVQQLRRYAEQVDNGSGYQRRLFADDAARGFAFIDVCSKHYDVVLMNPPFGESAKAAKEYIATRFPRTKNDVYAAFVERGVRLLPKRGMLGTITARTGFFLSSFQKWREEVLLKEAPPTVFADLGYGVLDGAKVEVAAYCLEVAS